MSHANGEIIQGDKVIGYFEYNGTSDVAISSIWNSYEEMLSHWRTGLWGICSCEKPQWEDVKLYTDYGRGFYWSAKVCLKCKTITKNLMPFEDDIIRTDGHLFKGNK